MHAAVAVFVISSALIPSLVVVGSTTKLAVVAYEHQRRQLDEEAKREFDFKSPDRRRAVPGASQGDRPARRPAPEGPLRPKPAPGIAGWANILPTISAVSTAGYAGVRTLRHAQPITTA